MYIVYNELSSSYPASSVENARNMMQTFIEVLRQTIRFGASNAIYIKDNYTLEEIGPRYRISMWLNDESVDIDTRRFLKSKITKLPYIDQYLEKELYEETLAYQFKFNQLNATCLGIAYLKNGIAISFNSHSEWDNSHLKIKILDYDHESDCFIEKEEQVRHASTVTHLEIHRPWLAYQVSHYQKLNSSLIKCGRDIVERSGKFFPSLIFCERVIAQLMEIKRGEEKLNQIIKKLFELEDYFSGWGSGPFNQHALHHCTPESIATKKQFSIEHTFICPDGQYRLFDWHLRYTPGAGRIFFYPDENIRKAIVGHIGGKLPTVSH